MSNIVVTGVAGFIGYHVANKLLSDGHVVFGIDNMNDYYDVDLKQARIDNLTSNHKKFIFNKIDINDGKMHSDYVKGMFKISDCVIHLAAQAGVRYSIQHPLKFTVSNLLGFSSILELSQLCGVEKIIFASSSSVYGGSKKFPSKENEKLDQPLSYYAATKQANELMAHSYSNIHGISTIGLRFFNAYGPWNRPDMALTIFAKAMAERKEFPLYNNGESIKDFTYVEDIAEGVVACLNLECKHEIINLGNGNNTKLKDYIDMINKSLARKADCLNSEVWPLSDNKPLPDGDIPISLADISKAKKLLKWKPKTSVKEGIDKFADWFVSYYYPDRF
jgi:UDP-glucuronate 4-epimerase